MGIGRIIIRSIEEKFTPLEFNLLATMLGLGLLAFAILINGLSGWFNSTSIFIVLAIAGFISCREWGEIGLFMRQNLRGQPISAANLYEKILLVIAIIFVPVLILNALTPVWDYDALMYHLEIPRWYLEEERIRFHTETFRTGYPFLVEMLFLIGLAFELDFFSKLISLTYATLLILSTYTFSIRFLSRNIAFIAIGILLGTPSIPTWATWASVDFAWAGYEFWSLYIVLLWQPNNTNKEHYFPLLAGALSGFAISTKYLSIATLPIVGVIILWRLSRDSENTIWKGVKHLLVFCIFATIIASPWYIKNWVWTGNPIYPLIFGGIGWDPIEAQVMNDYLRSFGIGSGILDFLLIPYSVYANHRQFSTFFLEIVHPALWLAVIYPVLAQSKKNFTLFFYLAVYYIIWAANSQVIRFLLPAFTVASVLAGNVIHNSHSFFKKIALYGILIPLLTASLIYQTLLLYNYSPYFSGKKSTVGILRDAVNNYQMTQHIQETLTSDERALFLWDGRSYYCDSRCIPDDEQSTAVLLTIDSPSPYELADELKEKGVTHLMVNFTDAEWFINLHDPNNYHQQAFDYLMDIFIPACGKSVYIHNEMELFEIICP